MSEDAQRLADEARQSREETERLREESGLGATGFVAAIRRQTTARRRMPCSSVSVFRIVGSPTPAARRSAWNASTASGGASEC